MVAVLGAGLPVRRLRSDGGDDTVPAEDVRQGQIAVDGGEPRAVAEQPAHRDVGLARRPELRPVTRDGRVEIELASLREPIGDDRGDPLGGGEHHDDGIALPGAPARHVGDPSPQVDDRPAIPIEAHRSADVTVVIEVGCENLAYPLEAGLDAAVDRVVALIHAFLRAHPILTFSPVALRGGQRGAGAAAARIGCEVARDHRHHDVNSGPAGGMISISTGRAPPGRGATRAHGATFVPTHRGAGSASRCRLDARDQCR